MSIPIVKGGFTQGLSKAGAAIECAAIWTGRKIESGFFKLVDAIRTLWSKSLPHLKDAATAVGTFFRTAPGFAVMGGLLGTVLGVTAECLGEEQKAAAIALRILAAGAFVGAGIAIGVGITRGFTTTLV